MNTERLCKILIELQAEFEDSEILTHLQSLKAHLTNQVNQPQVPGHQQNVANELKTIFEILDQAPSNDFSPGWHQVILELDASDLIGIKLKSRIESIFSRNQITPSLALEDFNKLYQKIEQFKQYIDNIVEGFVELNLSPEELNPGECEIGYLIPRKYTGSKLKTLQKEMAELNFILNNISEAVTGKKHEFEVRTISSSDFLVYVTVSLLVADALSRTLERIINNYKTILEIKKLRNDLKTLGVPSKETKGIENHANTMMEQEIKKIVNDIISERAKDKTIEAGRKNELINGLTISLSKLANRIDQGFNIEIYVEPLNKENEKSPELAPDIDKINSIRTASKTLEYFKVTGDPILSLKENSDKEHENSEDSDK